MVQQELQRKSRRKKAARKSSDRPAVDTDSAIANAALNTSIQSAIAPKPVEFTTQIDVAPQVARLPETVTVPVISPVVEQMLAQQSYSLTTLGDRLVELKNDLCSLERIVTDIQSKQEAADEPTVVPLVSPVRRSSDFHAVRVASQTEEELRGLSSNLSSLPSNLSSLPSMISSLPSMISDGFANTASAIPTIDLTPIQQVITQVAGLTEQLQSIVSQVDGLKSSVGNLEKAVESNVAATKEIAALPP